MTPAASARTSIVSASRSRCRSRARSRPASRRSTARDPEPRALHVRAGRAHPVRKETAAPELAAALRLAEEVATASAAGATAGARCGSRRPAVFAFDDRGGVERAWTEAEPHAHMLVEELMILANECVAALLAGRRREALFRVHERPDPQSVLLLLAKLADLDVPTPPAPEADRLGPSAAADLAAAVAERVMTYVRRSRSRHRGVSRARPPLAQAGALPPREPRPFGSGERPTAISRRRSAAIPISSSIARCCASSAPATLPRRMGSTTWRSTRPPGGRRSSSRADELCLAWLLETRLRELGWETEWEGEITGLIGSGLFVRFGEVFEGYVPVRRVPGYVEAQPARNALVGRRGGGAYRLGDRLRVRVADIRRHEGKVELSPAA